MVASAGKLGIKVIPLEGQFTHDLALCSLSHVLLPVEREVNVYSTISCWGVGRKYCQQLTLMIWLSAACPMSCCLWKGKSMFTVLFHAGVWAGNIVNSSLMSWLSAACPMSCCLWKGKSMFTVLFHAGVWAGNIVNSSLMSWLSAACPMSCCLWKGKSVFTVLFHAGVWAGNIVNSSLS